MKLTGSHPLNSRSRFSKLTRKFQTGGRFTLLSLVLLTQDWDEVSRAVFERQPVLIPFILLFVAMNTFGLLLELP